jgi:PPK2 family polyphosphate:nucleotide phosphotransferase
VKPYDPGMAEHEHGESRRWRVAPGTDVDLDALDAASTEGAPGDKQETKAALDDLRKRLRELQDRLWAEQKQSLLVVLQAMDGGGKDGTIKHVFRGVNPQGCRVTSFKKPTEDELAHDFLWRVHKVTPALGEIGIFNRSHYEDVLVVRVHDLVPEPVWRGRYELINAFESGLAAASTRVVKFYLHISKEEQAERFRRRLERPDKRWKFKTGDLAERERWDDYMKAFREAIAETSTEVAPWYVIPADKKWYRNWAVLTTLLDVLHDMDPQYPDPEENLDSVVVS